MADDKSFWRSVAEGVATAAIIGIGTWALKWLPVVGDWLSKGTTVPRWVLLALVITLPVIFVMAVRAAVSAVLSSQSRSTQVQHYQWVPDGLNLSALTALRTVDAGWLNEDEARKMLRALGMGTWPQADVSLALRELVGEGYASWQNDYLKGPSYCLADKGIRFAQREGIMPKSYEELRQLKIEMNALRD